MALSLQCPICQGKGTETVNIDWMIDRAGIKHPPTSDSWPCQKCKGTGVAWNQEEAIKEGSSRLEYAKKVKKLIFEVEEMMTSEPWHENMRGITFVAVEKALVALDKEI